MREADYISAAKKFAKNTSDWGGLDAYKHYVAVDGGEWVETCDNAEGGISVEWAFHLPADLIEEVGGKHFFAILADEFERVITEEWDLEQWEAFARRFT